MRMGCRWSPVRISRPDQLEKFLPPRVRLRVARMRWICVAALAAATTTASAQAYPVRPVKILVPFAAGGVADITARVLSQKIGEARGQQLIVENRPSAGGIVASEAVAKAEPDGYTLLFITNGNAVSASLFKSLPYDPEG